MTFGGCKIAPFSLEKDDGCRTAARCSKIRVLKIPDQPHREARPGQIGLYFDGGPNAGEIDRGKWIDIPEFDLDISAKHLEPLSTDLNDIGDASQLSGDGGNERELTLSAKGASKVVSGNTFLSHNRLTSLCPYSGKYYSPDGKIVNIDCDEISIIVSMTHWRIISGMFCEETRDDIGNYFCGLTDIKIVKNSYRDNREKEEVFIKTNDSMILYQGNVFGIKWNN